MDWCLRVAVVISRHCVIVDWPEAFVGVLMRLDNDVHTVLEEQRFEATEKKERKQCGF